ncbi:FAD-dependent oxidoreductase [Mesorhizobium sp. CO1-1-8]|uniref:FAD-dependent oxidoreductase n=1 Tax=Mesorhizobium sp. CO1-1-8 TaxID=2876631 RepID=UPI001CD08F11|nr:FAD-dependent oxidoreductase [Mesorhizobium sp. CO1-1-8]MBZ9775032.1 FAD-dependent oxidoreductase [Mesorhizobium sp. CO1-1-8]
MTAETYDVIVIGGGIIGAGAGQHLAAAGFRTLLLERGDYGAATSSRTSRLQHCGLTYFSAANHSLWSFLSRPAYVLECLELARRAMRERGEFVKTSPERIRKLEFVVPFNARSAISGPRARLAFGIMSLFDRGVPLDLKVMSAAEAKRHPGLQGMAGLHNVRGALSFTEYQYVWPERIVVETIMKARDIGLEAHNYAEVVAIGRANEGWSVEALFAGGESRIFRTKAIVNAAGAWVDEITGLCSNSAPPMNSGAKGTNAVVRLPASMRGIGMETITPEGAPFYLIPWGDLHYAGPWDTPSDADLAGYRATEAEVNGIVDIMSQIYPGIPLERADVLYTWAGVRPRTARKGEAMGSMAVCEHDLSDRGLKNFFVFTGGLLMTHRDAGRRLTKAVARRVKPSGPTRPLDYAARLVPDGDRVAESSVRWAIQKEQARTLEDILRRRLPVGWDEDLGLAHAESASRIAADMLGWSEDERQAQVADFTEATISHFNPRDPGRWISKP